METIETKEELGLKEECEHGINVEDFCEECRKEVINGLIGVTGRDVDGQLRDINLFDDITEIVVLIRNCGVDREISSANLNLDIDDFEDIDPDNDNSMDEAEKVYLERLNEVVLDIANNI